jgi:hypothetical protein
MTAVDAVAAATALAPHKKSRRLVGMVDILRAYRISLWKLALKPVAGYP